ncbi:MAG: nitrogen regulation protein NR(II) [Candidatus Zixiibacteriota bacterium]
MPQVLRSVSSRLEQRFTGAIVIVLALAVFILTWVGIRQSRSDSFELLVLQGKAFTEALAQAAENAIVSETFYDHLVHKRYAEIVVDLAEIPLNTVSNQQLAHVAQTHNLFGLFVFAADSNLVAGTIVSGPKIALPEFVSEEVFQLIANPENNYVLLLEVGEQPAEAVHYYLELTNTLDRVVVIMADALYYVNALQQTQIGYLAQKMAREQGVVYIMYQSTEGIIFSSRATGQILAIDSDPFLSQALESDHIMHRIWEFQGEQVLELVRPFATEKYPFGLLRVGLSLEGFYSVSKGFDRQMVALAGALFVLAVVALLYFNSRRKRKEIALQYIRMKSVTDRIFDEMRTGVAAVDRDGTITLANDAFERVFGVDHCVGSKWDDSIGVDKIALKEINSTKEASFEREITLSTDGSDKTLLVAASKLRGEADEPGGFVVVVYDITRLKEFERQSARRERLSEMGNLAAAVAHEIRNPLNTISIAIQRLASEFVFDENREEYLAITGQIRAETKRLDEIITRFLSLTREQEKRLKTVVLGDFIADMVEFLKPEADKLKIDISFIAEPDLRIEADPNSLKQVFINLFNNVKEALAGQAGKISITSRLRDGMVEITFSDSGPGVKKKLREKIFAPYFTTKESGTGLGLPTVHKIISELGGDIRVEDSELGGAAFVITIPQ